MMALQRPERAIAEVEEQRKATCLDQIAGGGAVRPRKAAGAADHSHPHGSSSTKSCGSWGEMVEPERTRIGRGLDVPDHRSEEPAPDRREQSRVAGRAEPVDRWVRGLRAGQPLVVQQAVDVLGGFVST